MLLSTILMPQLGPISWVLVAFFLVVMIVSVAVKVWWNGSVRVYRVWRMSSKGMLGVSRLFLWGKKS